MILADKIINERKKNGWSQEELAEQLSVSRQSVSKWEGAQSIPDLQKIIQMSQIFGVSTDYLLKDDIEETSVEIKEDTSYSSLRKVTLEEANEFIAIKKLAAPKVAIATALCILSPAVLIVLAGFSEASFISETFAVGVGLLILFLCIAVAVSLFIFSGHATDKFEYLKNEPFETQYGVSGMVKDLLEESQPAYTASTIIGSVLCIISPIPIIVAALLEAPDFVVCCMVGLLLVIIASAVSIFIITGMTRSCCQILLQEREFTKSQKELSKKSNSVRSAYWSIILVIYLAWSFITNNWGMTWIVWPIAGVLYGALCAVFKAIKA